MTTISDVPAQSLTRKGMAYMEGAVLMVLREAEYPLQPAEIAKEAGTVSALQRGMRSTISPKGFLDKLECDGTRFDLGAGSAAGRSCPRCFWLDLDPRRRSRKRPDP